MVYLLGSLIYENSENREILKRKMGGFFNYVDNTFIPFFRIPDL